MAKIILLMEGAFLGEYPLEKKRLVIGRLPACDIHIDNLAVSAQHATITYYRGKYSIKDMDSTNGVYVNGERVEKHNLQHLDIIEISKYQLKYVDNDLGVSFGGFEKTVLVQSEAKTPRVSPAAPAKNESSENPTSPSEVFSTSQEAVSATRDFSISPVGGNFLAKVKVLSGASAGRELVLNKSRATVGKPGVELAEINKEPQGYFIKHLEGVNPLIVNGSTVGGEGYLLTHHDVFELAGVKMQFVLEESKGFFAVIASFFKRFF